MSTWASKYPNLARSARKAAIVIVASATAFVAAKYAVVAPLTKVIDSSAERQLCIVTWSGTPIEIVRKYDPMCERWMAVN